MRQIKLTVDWGQGKVDHPHPTVPVVSPSELASPKEKARLFAGLEKFANLGDSFESFRDFLVLWPTFIPFAIRRLDENEAEHRPIDWTAPECHKLALVYRDVLRRLWQRDQNALAMGLFKFVLGIDNPLGNALTPYIPGLDHAWKQVMARYPKNEIELPFLFPDWGSGAFLFCPATDLQKAAYVLFRDSWRARICPCCSRLFIAQKAPQIYCSSRCYGMTKKRRGLDWWKQKGDEWRKARKASNKKSRRRRGK